MSEVPIGAQIAGYRVEALLGRGGMGVVYLAHDQRLGRSVALKVLSSDVAGDEMFVQRFLRETRLAASVDHPNIVPVYEAGADGEHLFLAMRYVDGSDLRSVLLREGALQPARAVTLVTQIAKALDAAHTHDLVHRDVKPGNILITAGSGDWEGEHAYLADFGLSKLTSSVSDLSTTGFVPGTLDYMSPEQLRGDAVDGRTDVYALGCVLYQCLTGRAPFSGSEVGVMLAHLQEPPPHPSSTDLLLGSFDTVVGTALAKSPDERYPTCAALARAAESALSAAPAHSRRGLPTGWRFAAVASVAVAAVALAVLSLTMALSGGAHPQHTGPQTGVPATPPSSPIAYPVGRRIMIIGPAGNLIRVLTPHHVYHSISWSHDYTQLVGARDGDIWVIDADAIGNQTQVTHGPAVDVDPAWSPDNSNTILFARQARGASSSGLYTVSADGSTPRRVGTPSGFPPLSFADPGWSPDGTRIVAEGYHGRFQIGQGSVYVMNRDGSDMINITRGMIGVDPSWSPKGNRISYRVEHVDAVDEVFVVNPDGSNRQRVLVDSYSPAWSPDGRFLVFLRPEPSSPFDSHPVMAVGLVDLSHHTGSCRAASPCPQTLIRHGIPFAQLIDPAWSASGS